ncbi:MAG: zf-HC2 domain-containing protein [Solirubrobacteraceae bacterium]|nr:zf-HC2 domain-containing protein [Solirubrobacteraceae bacterium]
MVAYCRHVAGAADAGAAAADAFARFRVAVVAAGDTTTLNPEALLISATRTSAAARAQANGQGDCADVPMLLAARADKTSTPADLERLESHLEQCWACRAPVARFKAAERAYRDPPEKTVGELLTAQIVGALIAAVPSAPPPTLLPESMNGSAEQAAAAAAAPPAALEQPTEHFAAPGMVEPMPPEPDADADADADAEAEAAIAAARRRRREKKTKKAAGAGPGAVLGRLRLGAKKRGPRERPARRERRPPREPQMLGAPRKRSDRSRSPLRLRLVLPIVLILLALLAALYVSGVFGGDDPASTPSVSAPTAAPTAAELDAVPGAKEATADDVESAKARARGEDVPAAKKQKQAEPQSAPAASPPPPAAANPPAAAPAVSANNPVNPPAPERDTESSDEKQIDAGSGATGAEQVPPAADASDVPDLAPPTDPATP